MPERVLKFDDDTIFIITLAFLASIVRGIVSPDRRGVLGFVSAAIVGLFVGTSAGIISSEFGLATSWQYLIASVAAIAGDRLVFAILNAATRFSEDPLGVLNKWQRQFFDKDSKQVKKYLERNDVECPVLIAGLSDKAKASESTPFLDRVRSYPTTIFLAADDSVKAIHTGFTGPATGAAYTRLKSRFENVIEGLFGQNK